MSVEFKKFSHILSDQAVAEEKMLKETKAGKFSFDEPYVKLNPYIIAPLTALVYFETPKDEAVTVTVKGKEKEGNMSFTYPKGKEHYIPVYGLYEDYENEIELSLESGDKKTIKLKTEKAPDLVKKPTKMETTSEYMGEQVVFVSPTSVAQTAAYDYRGDIRWYCTLNIAFDLKRIRNGRLLVGTHRLLMPPYHTTGLFELGMVGKIYNEFRIPGGYHHDQFEMEDGNILILTQNPPRGTVEDMCVLVDRKTGDIIKEWDYQEILPQDVGGSGSQDEFDWFHNNSVWFDKKTNSLTFSGRHQDAVINIDFDSGELNWVIGDPEGWPKDFTDKYFFKPVGDVENFDWQYEQHAAVILPDGDVMCFDNGHYRSKIKENYVPAKDNFSRGVRYRIDTDKMEIEQVWQFGKERGADFFSSYICNVEYYDEGHYMVHSGGTGKYKDEWCDKPCVYYMGEDEKHLWMNSITVELKDDEIVYEMHLPGNFYRAEKLNLYCEEDKLTFGKGKLLGTLGVTEEFTTIPDVEAGGMIPEKYKLKLGQEEDRLVMKASFDQGQMVMLLLEGKDKTHSYYVPTTRRPFLAMCVGTFMESDERAVELPVSFKNISGDFKISMIIDEHKYETGVEITV